MHLRTTLFFLLAISLLLSNCSSPNEIVETESDLENQFARGRVKSIKYYSYDLDTNQGRIPIPPPITRPLTRFETLEEFNPEGNYKRIQYFSEAGDLVSTRRFEYDSDGKLVKWKETGEDLPRAHYTEYSYTEEGNLETILEVGMNHQQISKEIYSYDDQGNRVHTQKYHDNEEVFEEVFMEYDGNGNMLTREYHRGNSRKIHHITTNEAGYITLSRDSSFHSDVYSGRSVIKRNKIGQWIDESHFDADDNLTFHHLAHYDTLGNMTRFIWTFDAPKLEELTLEAFNVNKDITHVYEYDDQMNWVRKVSYNYEMPGQIVEREIEYYD